MVGARPNFVKIAPVILALRQIDKSIHQILVHTGQHYDKYMSDVFFTDLEINQPDEHLGIGSGTHAKQTSAAMIGCEAIYNKYKPDLVLVVGDVNSTLAAAVTATKMDIKLAHVEAGLRSYDRSMPEEHNRVVTDHLSDVLFTPSEDASFNLEKEGIRKDRIHFVGNVMIDSLVRILRRGVDLNKIIVPGIKTIKDKQYAVLTLHRPSNVDNPAVMSSILANLRPLTDMMPVIFPVHPRTQKQLGSFDLSHLNLCGPLGYREFLTLESHAKLVLTDSGGVQEETTFLGVPCITIRDNTERPITIIEGTNVLANYENLAKRVQQVLETDFQQEVKKPIKFWDGKASNRIAGIISSRDWLV